MKISNVEPLEVTKITDLIEIFTNINKLGESQLKG